MTISWYKARCQAALARVKRAGEPVLVTRFGESRVEIVPPRPERWLGSFRDTGRVVGDIVAPVVDRSD